MKIKPRHWDNGGDYETRETCERIYFGEAYIERRWTGKARGEASYYDRHRIAKGDTVETATDAISLSGISAPILASALTAAFPGYTVREDKDHLWEFARGAALGYAYGPKADRKPRSIELPEVLV